MSVNQPAEGTEEVVRNRNEISAGTGAGSGASNPLCGVRGWLKCIVIVSLYVAPVLFVLSQISAWIAYVLIASRYPGIIVTGLLTTVGSGYLILRGIRVARKLRDIRPRAVQDAKMLLKLALAWTFISIPIAFFSGLSAENLLPAMVKQILAGVAGFAIWYSYFNVSKRVRATYPDWKD